jgi:hypothetical protein
MMTPEQRKIFAHAFELLDKPLEEYVEHEAPSDPLREWQESATRRAAEKSAKPPEAALTVSQVRVIVAEHIAAALEVFSELMGGEVARAIAIDTKTVREEVSALKAEMEILKIKSKPADISLVGDVGRRAHAG